MRVEFEEDSEIRTILKDIVATIICKEQLMRWLLNIDNPDEQVVMQSWEYAGVELDPSDEVEAALNRVAEMFPELSTWL